MSAKACEGEKPRKARRVLPDTPLRRNLSAWLTKSSRNFLVGALKSFCTLPILRITAATPDAEEFSSNEPAPLASIAGAKISPISRSASDRAVPVSASSTISNLTGSNPRNLRIKFPMILVNFCQALAGSPWILIVASS